MTDQDGRQQRFVSLSSECHTGLFKCYNICWVATICQSVLEQDTDPPHNTLNPLRAQSGGAKNTGSDRSTSQPRWFIDLLVRGMMSCSLHFGRFSFQRRDDFPLIRVKNQSCSVKLITSLLSPCHHHAASNKTVAGNSGGRIIFWSLHSSSRGFD